MSMKIRFSHTVLVTGGDWVTEESGQENWAQ